MRGAYCLQRALHIHHRPSFQPTFTEMLRGRGLYDCVGKGLKHCRTFRDQMPFNAKAKATTNKSLSER